MIDLLIKNYLTGTYVYYAAERLNRPHSKTDREVYRDDRKNCPFCPENSYMTPAAVYDDGVIRIVPNLYPFLSEKEGLGYHDVVIDTKNHCENTCDFSSEHMGRLIRAIKERCQSLEALPDIKYVQIFKNNGRNAGASLRHSHWQIGAQTIIPPKIKYMAEAAKDYYDKTGGAWFDSEEGYIRLYENEFFHLSVPCDGIFTYETHIICKSGKTSLTELNEYETKALGDILKIQLDMYKGFDSGLCYNICMYSLPKELRGTEGFSFFIQLIPRIGNMAGFEFSTGCYINSVLPEVCAETMKKYIKTE